MTTYILTRSIFQKELFLLKSSKLNLKLFWILGSILILTLFASFIFQTSTLTNQTYLLKNYEEELVTLSQKSKNLEIKFLEINSLTNIDKLVKEFNFEKVKNPSYIKILRTSVVVK